MIRRECSSNPPLACKKGEGTAPCNPRPAMSLWSYCSSRGGMTTPPAKIILRTAFPMASFDRKSITGLALSSECCVETAIWGPPGT